MQEQRIPQRTFRDRSNARLPAHANVRMATGRPLTGVSMNVDRRYAEQRDNHPAQRSRNRERGDHFLWRHSSRRLAPARNRHRCERRAAKPQSDGNQPLNSLELPQTCGRARQSRQPPALTHRRPPRPAMRAGSTPATPVKRTATWPTAIPATITTRVTSRMPPIGVDYGRIGLSQMPIDDIEYRLHASNVSGLDRNRPSPRLRIDRNQFGRRR